MVWGEETLDEWGPTTPPAYGTIRNQILQGFKMNIGDLVQLKEVGSMEQQRGILTNLSDCGTMAWVAWMHIGMKEARIPARYIEVIG